MGWPELFDMVVHGYVDLAMGAAAELSRAQVVHRSATDGWDPYGFGAWRLPTHADTPRFRLEAAVRRCGPDAVADRYSALALRGVASAFPAPPQVLLPHEARVRRLPAPTPKVRRTRRLLASHLDEVDGIPCVSAARALVNLAADLRTPALRSLALAAERDGHMRPGELARVLDDAPRNLPGRGRLRQVVEELTRDGSESGFEATARTRMVDHGLRPDPDQPVVLVEDVRRRIDIAWLVLRVGVECQGYGAHTGALALDLDAGRLNALAAEADWLILQLTPTILHEQWPAFLAQLRRCLVRRAAQFGLPAPPGTATA